MARSCFWGLTVLSLALALAITIIQAGWSESAKIQKPSADLREPKINSTCVPPTNTSTCAIYALGDLGNDPNVGKWIADTIPKTIQPGTWSTDEKCPGWGQLSYYAPGKILVVYQTPGVQAQVDAFLKNLKQALPKEKDKINAPAMFSPPQKTSDAGRSDWWPPLSHPQTLKTERPKHMFVIRYEGEGVIDSNVVKLFSGLNGEELLKAFGDALQGQNTAKENEADRAKPATDSAPPTIPSVPSVSPAAPPQVQETPKVPKEKEATAPTFKLEIRDIGDPVEVGQRMTYEIKVTNQGSQPANQVEIKAFIPKQMKFVGSKGPSRETVAGQVVTFAKVDNVAKDQVLLYNIEVETVQAGDVRCRVELRGENLDPQRPVVAKESTTIFNPDQE